MAVSSCRRVVAPAITALTPAQFCNRQCVLWPHAHRWAWSRSTFTPLGTFNLQLTINPDVAEILTEQHVSGVKIHVRDCIATIVPVARSSRLPLACVAAYPVQA